MLDNRRGFHKYQTMIHLGRLQRETSPDKIHRIPEMYPGGQTWMFVSILIV